jgi:hypothetical protein
MALIDHSFSLDEREYRLDSAFFWNSFAADGTLFQTFAASYRSESACQSPCLPDQKINRCKYRKCAD